MTRIVSYELEKKKIGYRYLHGGIPSEKRKDLVTDFNNQEEISVFLSTDAGGTGLNLQSASTIINLDLPWNPAVLEQRIARIHRIGQENNISVINMISANTIEHQMMHVIGFKAGLAEGILDAGEDIIYMGDSKFKQFMKTVDDLVIDEEDIADNTAYISKEEAEEQIAETHTPEQVKKSKKQKEEPGVQLAFEEMEGEAQKELATTPLPEENLLAQGLSLLGKLSETLANKEATRKLVSSVMEKDKETGKTYVKIPVESQEVVENVVQLLGNLFSGFSKRKN
jgi:superfamily II DNA/RNA helicase